MANQWYRQVNGKSVGPIAPEDLMRLAQTGQLRPDELVFLEGSPGWVAASRVTGLVFAAANIVPPALPLTSPASISAPPGKPITLSVSPNIPGPLASDPLIAGPLPPARGPQSRYPTWLVPAVAASVALFIVAAGILTAGLAWSTSSAASSKRSGETGSQVSAKPPQKDSPSDAIDARSEKLHDELKGQRDALRKEIQNLEERRNKLDHEARELEEQRDKLKKEVENLVSRVELLNQWREADFVLLNPTHLSVAVKDTGTGLNVVNKAEGELAEATLGASRNLHIPRIPDDIQLTRDVFQRVAAGESIPPDLVARIRKSVWAPQQFVDIDPNDEPDLVVFRDLTTHEIRLGYLVPEPGASKAWDVNGINYRRVGAAKSEKIYWKQMQPGSARHGRAEDLLPVLSDVDFLDYTLLRVAQKLGSGNKPAARPKILVHVDIDIPNDHKEFYDKLDKQIEDQGRTPESIEASGALGILAFLIDLGVRTSAPARRLALREEMLRSDPHRRSRHLSRFVEDEVLARLSSLGVSAVSKKDVDKFNSLELPDVLHGATLHDATHLLMVTVKDARGSGDYHLSVRLYHEGGREVWANAGDRILDTGGVGRQFHVATGQLAILAVKENSFEQFIGQETPPVMPGVKARSKAERFSHLVYLESPRDSAVVRYRPLFDPNLHEALKEKIESIRTVSTVADVPQDHVLRYVAIRLAEALHPAAGRVLKTGDRAGVVGIGRQQGVAPGDRLRVLRLRSPVTSLGESDGDENWSYGLFAGGQSVLPTEIAAVEVDDRQSTVTFSSTGFEDVWKENAPLQPGDLVLGKVSGTRVVQIETPVLVPPIPQIITRLGINKNPLTKQKFEADAHQTATQIAELIGSALTRIRIPVVHRTQIPQTRNRRNADPSPSGGLQPTHRVFGSITLSPKINVEARSNARPVYRLEIKISPIGSDEITEQFDFDLKDFVMPSRAGS